MSQTTVTGYRKRPWLLTLLAVLFACVPLLSWLAWSTPTLLAGHPEAVLDVLVANFGTGVNGVFGVFHAVWLAFLWVLFLVVAYGIFRVTKWGFFLCIVAALANSLFSTVQYEVFQGQAGVEEVIGFNPFQTGVLLNLVFFVPVLLILNKDIMAPFFNPKLKWWEQHPRVKALLRIEATMGGEKKEYQSFDISASGMFLGTGEVPPLKMGESFPAVIHLEESGVLVEVTCKTVWISDGKGRSPAGCGVTFTYPNRQQKKALFTYLKEKIRAGHVIERR